MINLFTQKEIIVYDTEYTTWEGAQERRWSGPNEFKEIVQIGAVIVDTKNFKEIDSISIFVHPVKNPHLSKYFINLTHITQEEVDTRGIDLTDAINQFYKWSRGLDLYSYGTDAEVIEDNCKLIGVSFPFEKERVHNVKEIFRAHGIAADDYMSSTIVRAFGKEPAHRGHNALNDVRILTKGLLLLKHSLNPGKYKMKKT